MQLMRPSHRKTVARLLSSTRMRPSKTHKIHSKRGCIYRIRAGRKLVNIQDFASARHGVERGPDSNDNRNFSSQVIAATWYLSSMVHRAVQNGVPRGQLVPREHTAYDGTPFYDEVLELPQGEAHRIMVYETGSIIDTIAQEAGARFLSDQPIWYLDPEEDRQRVFYGDWVIANDVPPERITADDLRAAIEIVSIGSRKKEVKDTQVHRSHNEYNGVPEFGLIFPDASDPRSIRWFRLVDGRTYQEVDLAPTGQVEVAAIPGLVLRVRPQSTWTDGRKIDVLYNGELRPPLAGERERYLDACREAAEARARAEQEKARAEQEKARAEQEKARAEQEKARAEKLAARLRGLGIDPENQ